MIYHFRMRRLSILAAALLAWGCSDIKDKELSAETLEDPAALASISNRLEPAERRLFGQYVSRRMMSVTMPSLVLEMPDGGDPSTVGEAIDLMRGEAARRAKIEALEEEREKALAPIDEKMEALRQETGALSNNDSIRRYNALVDERNAVLKETSQRIETVRGEPTRLIGAD